MSILNWLPWYTVPLALLGFALPAFLLFKQLGNASERSRLLKVGVAAQAEIVRLWETGVQINNQPQVGFELRVTPPSGPPYVTQTTMVISTLQIPRVQPGARVDVRLDPQQPTKVAIIL